MSQEFYFITPITITDSMLVSSNVTEDDYDEYASGTTYATDDEVQVSASGVHKVFRSIIDSNTGNQPEDNYITDIDDQDDTTPIPWLYIGPTNKWGMFDGRSRAVTSNESYIEVEFITGEPYNGFGLVNVVADYVYLTITDDTDGIVHSEQYDLVDLNGISGIYEWLFYPPKFKSVLVVDNLPIYPNATVKIFAFKADGYAEIGECVIGLKTDIGGAKFGYEVGVEDYTKTFEDANGVPTMSGEQGIFKKSYTQSIMVDPDEAYWIQSRLAEIRATPVLFVGASSKEETVIYGPYEDFTIRAEYGKQYLCDIEVKELS